MLQHEELMAETEMQVNKTKSSRGEKVISKYNNYR